LLPGIAAVFRGENFISSRLGNSEKGGDPVAYESTGATTHAVSFYPDDASLVDGLSRCITSALDSGRVAVAVLTEPHRASVLRKLRAYRTEIDVDVQQ